VDISDYLMAISTTYNHLDSMSSEGQLLLRGAPQRLAQFVPDRIIIQGSGGKGKPTFTPWIGFFDPSETASPENGLYVVYLFASSLEHVTLSLLQGITKLSSELGAKRARQQLASDASTIRQGIPPQKAIGWSPTMDLGTKGIRQRAYVASNVLARQYSLRPPPPEAALRSDLATSIDLYQHAIIAKRKQLHD
jgi:hypothetical protein